MGFLRVIILGSCILVIVLTLSFNSSPFEITISFINSSKHADHCSN